MRWLDKYRSLEKIRARYEKLGSLPMCAGLAGDMAFVFEAMDELKGTLDVLLDEERDRK